VTYKGESEWERAETPMGMEGCNVRLYKTESKIVTMSSPLQGKEGGMQGRQGSSEGEGTRLEKGKGLKWNKTTTLKQSSTQRRSLSVQRPLVKANKAMKDGL